MDEDSLPWLKRAAYEGGSIAVAHLDGKRKRVHDALGPAAVGCLAIGRETEPEAEVRIGQPQVEDGSRVAQRARGHRDA